MCQGDVSNYHSGKTNTNFCCNQFVIANNNALLLSVSVVVSHKIMCDVTLFTFIERILVFINIFNPETHIVVNNI